MGRGKKGRGNYKEVGKGGIMSETKKKEENKRDMKNKEEGRKGGWG